MTSVFTPVNQNPSPVPVRIGPLPTPSGTGGVQMNNTADISGALANIFSGNGLPLLIVVGLAIWFFTKRK